MFTNPIPPLVEDSSPPDKNDDSEAVSGSTNEADVADSSEYSPGVLELDEVFAALGHPRRRYLLYTLVNEGGEETLPELATKVAAWEQNKPSSEVTDEERNRIHVSLYHSHIPKLADLNVLDFHRDEDIIVQAVNTEQVEAVLRGGGGEEDARQETHAQDTDGSE